VWRKKKKKDKNEEFFQEKASGARKLIGGKDRVLAEGMEMSIKGNRRKKKAPSNI